MDRRKATALVAASILTVGAGSVSLAVDLGLFNLSGAAAMGRPATLTKGSGTPTVVKVFKDVTDPASRTLIPSRAKGAKSTAHPVKGTGTAEPEGTSTSSTLHETSTDSSVPPCTEPPEKEDSAEDPGPSMGGTSTTKPGDDHAEADDSGEKGSTTSSTTEAVSPSDDHTDHAEADDSGEKDSTTSSTTKAMSPSAAQTGPSCSDSTTTDPEDSTSTSTPSSSTPPTTHHDG